MIDCKKLPEAIKFLGDKYVLSSEQKKLPPSTNKQAPAYLFKRYRKKFIV
jgi:hypothetical protein